MDPLVAAAVRDVADRYRFRTPSLRNVALTAPYMHDGSLATLADVIAFYESLGYRIDDTVSLGKRLDGIAYGDEVDDDS